MLVMWEYFCAHSPIWARSRDLDIGQLDARDLGLPEALRDDLADWNSRCEIAADPNELFVDATTPSGWRALQAEAFGLAARVQRGLGDDWTVWCLAGGGDGGLRDPGAFGSTRRSGGPQLLLTASGIVEWTPDWTEPRLDRFGATLRRELHAWIGSVDRLPPAEYRADALETAGRLHASLASGRLLWFGGEDVPP